MTPEDLIKAVSAGVSLDELLTPGLCFVLVEHEPDCPGAQGDRIRCHCDPRVRMVSEAEYAAALSKTQDECRAARRAAERALEKAKRKDGKQ